MNGVRRLLRSAACAALTLSLACGAGDAFAAPAASPAPAGSSSASTTRPSATGARSSGTHAVARTRTKSHAPRRTARHVTAAAGATPAPANTGPRRLDDIAIEGEIPVPQVLFITARDQRRFLDAAPSRYVRTSRQVADATPAPTRVIVVADTAHAAPAGGSR
jgi:hypothetical protein